MKELFSLLFCFITIGATAQLKPTDVEINDSLGLFETRERAVIYDTKADSTNRLKVDCGISDYFKGNFFTLNYINGVCYMAGQDTLVLFMVDFRNTENEVTINRLELESGLSLKKFERQIRRCQCKNTREEVERIKGVKEIAYTVYKDESGLGYRAFFRDGQLHSLLMYIPCKE